MSAIPGIDMSNDKETTVVALSLLCPSFFLFRLIKLIPND